MHQLRERDGWLYITASHLDLKEPKEMTSWWPLQVRFADFAPRFASPEEARKHLGQHMAYLGDGLYRDQKGLRYRLVDGGQTKPQFTDITPVPEPRQRGRKLPVEWRNGCWYKCTSRGWKRV